MSSPAGLRFLSFNPVLTALAMQGPEERAKVSDNIPGETSLIKHTCNGERGHSGQTNFDLVPCGKGDGILQIHEEPALC